MGLRCIKKNKNVKGPSGPLFHFIKLFDSCSQEAGSADKRPIVAASESCFNPFDAGVCQSGL